MLWFTGMVRREVREATGAGPEAVLVSPVFAASWRRDVVVATPDRYELGHYDVTAEPALRLRELRIARGPEHEASVIHSSDLRARAFSGWARFPFYRREGHQVIADDARYSTGGASFARVVVPVLSPGAPPPATPP